MVFTFTTEIDDILVNFLFFLITLSSLPINLFPERVGFTDVPLLFWGFWEKHLVGLVQKNNHQVVVAVQAVLVVVAEKNHFV